MADERVKFKAELTMRCPFCFGEVLANSRPSWGEVGILHSEPACKEFLSDEDPADFLAKCRKKMTEN